ncbi:hypothetical protein [Pedobacter sp. SL55]|uniref:hypothetical protein n=1 Tax=Pedobacter sp. SL55 TaxID=2995161 RepID=UPI00227025A0|nr:hypothetical protein [Pedobacter sp. SL55]WAC41052.1 hypothetical protein OVA16_01355 [Pedobacter sp. SL55]
MEKESLTPAVPEEAQLAVKTFNYRAKLSRVHVNILYSMMLLRITRGYSSAEASFLMGHASNTIGELETLAHKDMPVSWLCEMLEALGEPSYRGIIFTDFGKDVSCQSCEMQCTRYEKYVEHTLFRTDSEGKANLVYKVFETNPNYVEDEEREGELLVATRDILALLFNGRYFIEAKSPAAIYQKCSSLLGSDMKPRHAQQVLAEMIAKRGYPKLRRNVAKRKDKITYEKILK